MLYTWHDVAIAAAIIIATVAGAAAHLALGRRREARSRDLERTLRIERYDEPPHFDLTLAWAHHNALLLKRLGPLAYLGYVATRHFHVTIPSTYRDRDKAIDTVVNQHVHSHHYAGPPAIDIAT